ncbi:Cytosine-specific methyltransferase [Mycena venus]|uniref:Cytosine-specific methyltransferase n=1 Tax=Mycena venus TaxID=2733690 RepID=A0A8H6X3Z8_9AGAR|nr:Cytosine-specific methyltransferase [Mycena venus]
MINHFSPLLVAMSRDLSTVSRLNINTVPLIKALKMARFSKHLDIPKMSTGTVLTPNIARVVGPYINGPIRVVGSDLAKADRVLHKRLGYPGYYESVALDGDTFRIGDIVSVKPGVDGDEERAKSSVFASKCCVNSYARCVWFIKIEFYFDDEMEKDDGKPTKMLHGTWLVHGRDTILQEVTHSQELFMLEECDNIKVSSIYRKCDVRKLDAGEKEHPDEGNPQADTFFYQCCLSLFRINHVEDERRVKSLLPEHRPCTNCGFAAEDVLHSSLRPIGPVLAPNGFTPFGHKYHKGDFIYLRPNISSAHPLLVAQITAIDGLQSIDVKEDDIVCYIRYFKRYTKGSTFYDEIALPWAALSVYLLVLSVATRMYLGTKIWNTTSWLDPEAAAAAERRSKDAPANGAPPYPPPPGPDDLWSRSPPPMHFDPWSRSAQSAFPLDPTLL